MFSSQLGQVESSSNQGVWMCRLFLVEDFQCRGRPTILITVGQGPTALAVGAGGGWFGHFYSHLSFHSSFSLSFGRRPDID